MPGPTYDFRNDPLLQLGVKPIGDTLSFAERIYMDEYARQIFDLWVSGKAPSVVIFDKPKWAAYMRADKGLHAQIDRQLIDFALGRRDEFFRSSPQGKPFLPNQPYQLQFHAEVGSKYGGYKTGYSVLHGSNRNAGDFQIQGMYSMAAGAASKLNFTFINNQMTFNDIVDPNFKYKLDADFSNVYRSLALAKGTLPPKNYVLRIRWSESGPWIYSIPAEPSKPGAAPDWLRKFPNR